MFHGQDETFFVLSTSNSFDNMLYINLLHKVGIISTEAKGEMEYAPGGITPHEEKTLVAGARRGDAAAFERLIEATSRRIFALLNRMISDPSDVEDVAQNTYLKAWTGLANFRGKSTFYTWIYRIAVNEALGYIRRVSGRRGWEVDGEDKLKTIKSGKPVDGAIIDRITVREALAKLPHAYRTAISLSYMDDLKYEEAAEVMEVPLNTFKTYLHRGKIKLREIMEGDEL